MKIIILAAGIGSRLKGVGSPKALTLLDNGQSILEFQLEQIARYSSISDVTVVVGYKQDKIRNAFPQLRYVENPDFAKENTSKSLLRAIQDVDQEILWLNGDVVFHHHVLRSVLERRLNSMVVNSTIVGEEEVKYRTDGAGQILEVSKQVLMAEGEAVGINFFSHADLPLLKQALQECADHDYFEKGLEICIQKGCKIWTIAIDKPDCIEIDFPEDLQKANVLMKNWESSSF